MRWLLVAGFVAVVSGAAALVRARIKSKGLEGGSVSDEWIAHHRGEVPRS